MSCMPIEADPLVSIKIRVVQVEEEIDSVRYVHGTDWHAQSAFILGN